MLQLSGFGATSDEFMECMGAYNDLEFCRTMYPQTANDGLIPKADRSVSCGACDPSTQWCDDDGRCVPFTAEEQAAWAAAGKPSGKIATSPRPRASWIPGVSNKTVMIGAGLAVAALLLLRR